jgi:hypothetical protein
VVRSRRAILCAFNLTGQIMNVPVRSEAIGAWTLRLSTDAMGYGGSGAAINDIPSDELPAAALDAPKRLLEPKVPLEKPIRVVRLPAWTAAVFVRDFASDAGRT